jgi:hypothetical protein
MKPFKRFTLLLVLIMSWVLMVKAIAVSASYRLTSGDLGWSMPQHMQSASQEVFLPLLTAEPGSEGPPGTPTTYYLSPTGDDGNSGRTEADAWATFDRALNARITGEETLGPGDTLILMDGTYYQSLHPHGVTGEPGRPITVRAQHDGRAIIDGQGTLIPIWMERYRAASYFIIEGIVARNSSGNVLWITADNNVFRRVSAYNANTDKNTHVIAIAGGYNLLEDCVAAGTGRKMIIVFGEKAPGNTVRRCFADWREWDGRNWCGSHYPWGEGIEFYNASSNTVENSIAYGHTPRAGISIMSQYPGAANGNRILGSVAILSGMNEDRTPVLWGPDPNNPPLTQLQPITRPGPTTCTIIQQFDEWPALRAGIRLGESGEIRDTLLQDILAWGSAGTGLAFHMAGDHPIANNRVNRATISGNGLDNISKFGGIGTDANQTELARFASIQNSIITRIVTGSSYTSISGEGARLTHRYINGVLMDGSNGQPAQPLWPWPMEDRIQAELGISVTEMMTEIIFGPSH